MGITIDSGAADHVMPKGWVMTSEVRPSKGSMNTLKHVAAGGHTIPNADEQDVRFTAREGVRAEWVSQFAGVNKLLASVPPTTP